MQNMPVKDVGLRYRNAFVCDEDEDYVGSDFVSQELVFMAVISGEPVWLDVLRKGEDLHSVCAEMIKGKIWRDAAEPGCAYVATRQKCKCKQHKKMRDEIKSINFGIPYGMSHFKLAADLKIPVPEARALLALYFKTFPYVDRMLKAFGSFGVMNGFIMSRAPFYRRRWFPFWKYAKHNIHHFMAGVIHDSNLGSIERQSKNMPIQGSSADVTKVAICLVYWYIGDNNLWDIVKMAMQVHDALDTISKKYYSQQWAVKLTELMEEAALYSIPNGLLKSETNITEVWSK